MAAPTKRERRAARRTSDPDGRLEFFETARAHTRYLGITCDEGEFVVSTRSEKMGKHLFSKRARPEFRVLRRATAVIEALLGRVDPLFIDVGANIGTSTIAALRLPAFETAVSCEPEPENFRLLGANLALNGLDHVQRFRVAVSSHPGSAQLVVLGGPPGKTWVATDPQQIRKREARREDRLAEDPSIEFRQMTVTEVELVTLDGLVESGVIDPEQAGMLWIDVEGHEGHVLAGAGTLTERGLPIIFEFDPEPLAHRGDREAIHEVAEGCYTHFVDVRRQEPGRRRFDMRPVVELRELAERWLDPTLPGRFSDLLMLRLDAGQARLAADLPQRMRLPHGLGAT